MIKSRLLKYGILLVLFTAIVISSFYAGRHIEKESSSIKTEKAVPDTGKLTMAHQHAGQQETDVHIPNSKSDACRILIPCFPEPDSIYKDLSACHENMKLILKYYHNSAILDDGVVVGFISFHIETASPSTAISMYNVCVDPAYRGRGIAKRLIADGVEEQRRHAKLGSKLLLGLDVDLTTEFAAESFALYAKLGFLRGWQPCRSVGDVDWRPVLEQPASSLVRSPMADILAMPQKYLENEVMGKNPGQRLRSRRSSSSDPYSHFCMFRLYDESWMSMGKFLAEPWQPDGVMNKSNKTNPNDQRQAN